MNRSSVSLSRSSQLLVLLFLVATAFGQIHVTSIELNTEQGASFISSPSTEYDVANATLISYHARSYGVGVYLSIGQHFRLNSGFRYRNDGYGLNVQFSDITGELVGVRANVWVKFERIGIPLEFSYSLPISESTWEPYVMLGASPMYLLRVRSDQPYFPGNPPQKENGRLVGDVTTFYNDWGLLASGGIGIDHKFNSKLGMGIRGRYTRDLLSLTRKSQDLGGRDVFLGSASLHVSLLFFIDKAKEEVAN